MSAFTATHLAVSVSSSVEMCFVTAAPHTCQVAGGARRSDGEMRGGVRSRARGLPRGPRRRAGSPECGSGVGSRQLCDAGSVMHPSEPQRPRLAVTEQTLAPGAGGAVSSQCRGNSDIVCAGKTPPPCCRRRSVQVAAARGCVSICGHCFSHSKSTDTCTARDFQERPRSPEGRIVPPPLTNRKQGEGEPPRGWALGGDRAPHVEGAAELGASGRTAARPGFSKNTHDLDFFFFLT